MKTKFISIYTIAALFLMAFGSLHAQTKISGTVVDDETGEPIPGATVIVSGGSSVGTVADIDGNFTLSVNQEPPFIVEISSVGFSPVTADITSTDQVLTVSLEPGENLSAVVISASRRPQKIQEAPASVSIISARDIENGVTAVDPIRHLANTPGVHLQQQTANTINVGIRGASGVFGTSAFIISDYRYLTTPASGQYLSFQSGVSNLDLAKVEVVRGAASALYGPNVTAGVVHFLTKSPIDYPGFSAEIIGGTLSTLAVSSRYAYASEDKKFGFKINARLQQGQDFYYDPNNVDDARILSTFKSQIFQPAISNDVVDPTLPGTLLLNVDDVNLDRYKNFSVNTHLEFRPTDDTTGFLSGGVNQGGGLFFNSQGVGYTQGTDYWGQARIQSGGLFAQVYYNYNDGGTAEKPTYLLNSGFRQVAERRAFSAQVQYNFDIPAFLDSNFTIGSDYIDTTSNSDYTLWGRNENNDAYDIFGAYLQGTTPLGEKLELTYAVRYDQYLYLKSGSVSPRAALVYKIDDNNALRFTYNRATFTPTALELFIDFPVNVPAPGIFDIWLAGQISPQTFNNPTIDISIPGVPNLPVGTPGLPLSVPYAGVAELTIAGLVAGLQSTAGTADDLSALTPLVQNFFATYQGPQGVTGSLYPYDIFDGATAAAEGRAPNFLSPENLGASAAQIGFLDSFEIGYKGVIAKKLSLGVDVYTSKRTGFRMFSAIAPTYALVGSNLPTDLGTAVGADFVADPTIRGALQAAVTQGTTQFYQQTAAQLGIPVETLNAGLPQSPVGPIPSLADAIAGQLMQTINEVEAQVNGAFAQGGAAFESQVSALYPIIGAIESDRVPQGDGVTHSVAGYRSFGDASRDYYGVDLSAEYFINDEWTVWGNYSWLSQNVWIPGEPNDDGLPFPDFLNVPKNKYRAGVNYISDKLRANLTFQHDDSFPSNQGIFQGDTDEKNLFDASVGYIFSKTFSLDLSGTNIFNNRYRAFPNMPQIGSRFVVKATLNFN